MEKAMSEKKKADTKKEVRVLSGSIGPKCPSCGKVLTASLQSKHLFTCVCGYKARSAKI